MSKNVDNLRSAHESWNRRNFEGVTRDVADNVHYVDRARNEVYSSKQNFRQMVEEWAHSLPDGKLVNPQYIDAGNTVISQFTIEGTNTAPFAGLPATGRRVSLPMCEIVRCDQNGRVISADLYYDQYTMLVQLGHIQPTPAAA